VVNDMCSDGIVQENCTGTFIPDTICDSATSCLPVPPIEGCCQLPGEGDNCRDTTNVVCAAENGAFFEGGMCMLEEFCELPPEGCCVIEPGVCEITTEGACAAEDGDYQGDGSFCEGNPECEVPIIPTNVPTIGQWGMIAMAGLLGIFSLFIIMRRHRYNVS
jgi:hypothetical protein